MVKRKNYVKGNTFGVQIKMKASDKALDWLNNQSSVSNSVWELIEKYSNNELIPVEMVKSLLNTAMTRKEITNDEILNALGKEEQKCSEKKPQESNVSTDNMESNSEFKKEELKQSNNNSLNVSKKRNMPFKAGVTAIKTENLNAKSIFDNEDDK